jgi:hypothetical protein
MIVVDTNIIGDLYLPAQYAENTELLLRKEPQWAVPILWKSTFRNILTRSRSDRLATLKLQKSAL